MELAAAYLLNSGESDEEWEDVEQSCKMVFVVNTDLKMSVGKTAAQVNIKLNVVKKDLPTVI